MGELEDFMERRVAFPLVIFATMWKDLSAISGSLLNVLECSFNLVLQILETYVLIYDVEHFNIQSTTLFFYLYVIVSVTLLLSGQIDARE